MESRKSGNNESKGNVKNDNNSNWLPRDIIYEILTRVPAESLLRFKGACKLWKIIISDPKFISSHLHIWQSKPSVMFTADFQSDRLFLSDLPETDSTYFPIHIPKGYRIIVASTDGLFILRASYLDTKLCVHNPITGSQKLLPPYSNRRLVGTSKYFMVYDASIQKYKVLVFINNLSIILVKIKIITVDSDGGSLEWRKLISPSAFCLKGGFKPITVNGILYWLAYTYDIYKSIHNPFQVAFVQSMDIAKEEFMLGISLPCQPKSNSLRPINCNLLEMKGSIYFSNPVTDMELELWMLEDLANHIWVKRHKICLLSIVGKPNGLSSFLVGESFYPIQMMWNHEWMMIHHDDVSDEIDILEARQWYLYNLRSQELKAIVSRSTEAKMCYFYSREHITHVKSLVGWN